MAERRCSVSGCDKPHYARGLCDPHYRRAKIAGTLPPKLPHYNPCPPKLGPRRLSTRTRYATAAEAFLARCDKRGPDECWPWTGSLSPKGYGIFSAGGKGYRAHRFAYEFLVGPIPAGLVIDHLCRVRHCVNPAHMEPVTNVENVMRGESFGAKNARKTHCIRGHEFNEENTWYRTTGGKSRDGDRFCMICHRIRAAEQWKRRKAKRERSSGQSQP